MKQLLLKIPAMLAMVLTLFSFGWYVMYLFDWGHDETWLLSIIMAMFSTPFFFVDAIVSFVKARKKVDSRFNYILALVLIGAIPMVVFVGGDGRDHINVIWYIYYLMMFVFEVISIKKAWDAMKAGRTKLC